MALACPIILNRRAVHQQDVHPSVVVVVEGRSATTLRFEDVEFFFAAAGEMKITRRASDVDEKIFSARRRHLWHGLRCGGGFLPWWNLGSASQPKRADENQKNYCAGNPAEHSHDRH